MIYDCLIIELMQHIISYH